LALRPRFWGGRGYLTEGRERLAQALASAPGATASRAKALETAGSLAFRQADLRSARSLQEESLAIRRELGYRLGIAVSLEALAELACGEQGQPGAGEGAGTGARLPEAATADYASQWRFSRDGVASLALLRDGGNDGLHRNKPLNTLVVGAFDGGPRAQVVRFNHGPVDLLSADPDERLWIWRGLGTGNAFIPRSEQNMR
jgi:hypothetical protein